MLRTKSSRLAGLIRGLGYAGETEPSRVADPPGLFAILCRRDVAARRPRAILPITAGLYLTVMASVYLFSAYVPYQQHVISSYFRLAAHVVALPLHWIADHGRAAR
jgi:hypothetical protein